MTNIVDIDIALHDRYPDESSSRPDSSPEAILEVQSHVLQLVIEGKPLDAILTQLSRAVAELAPGARGQILTFNANGRVRLPAGIPGFDTAVDADRGPNWQAIGAAAETMGCKAAWAFPIVAKDKRIAGAFAICFDESRRPSAFERRMIETFARVAALAIGRHEADHAMTQQRDTLNAAMQAAEMGAWRYTFADNICLYDERAQLLYGLTDGRFLHDEGGAKNLIHADDLPGMWAAVAAACDPSNGRYDVEYRVKQLDGSWRWVSAWGIVEFEPNAAGEIKPVAITGASRDISKTKLAEERQLLLVNELNHRVKNTLATVQAIAHQTLRTSTDLPSLRQAIDARITSLARAHDLLTARNWASAELSEVVTRATQPFTAARFEVAGPPLQISPKHALAISMAMHELATNAAKYGCLSNTTGRVAVTWAMRDGTLTLTWREHGGPPVKAPARRGFGSRLLEQSVAHDLGGACRLDYAADGLVWKATVAL